MVTTTFGGGGLGGAKAYPQPLMWIAKSAESVVRIPRRKIFGSLPAFSSQIRNSEMRESRELSQLHSTEIFIAQTTRARCVPKRGTIP
jgi:hypothetical protein